MNRRLGCLIAVLALVGAISWGCSQAGSQPETPRTSGGAFQDATITASVKIALAFEPGVAATDINVDTDGGIVTLRGEVGTEAERQLAEKVAEDVVSVTQVVNELTVRG